MDPHKPSGRSLFFRYLRNKNPIIDGKTVTSNITKSTRLWLELSQEEKNTWNSKAELAIRNLELSQTFEEPKIL